MKHLINIAAWITIVVCLFILVLVARKASGGPMAGVQTTTGVKIIQIKPFRHVTEQCPDGSTWKLQISRECGDDKIGRWIADICWLHANGGTARVSYNMDRNDVCRGVAEIKED